MKKKPRMELVRVAASPEFMLNGVAVSPRGRVFASFPRWTSLAAPSVMEWKGQTLCATTRTMPLRPTSRRTLNPFG
jgi:hypothetical protein